MRENTDPLRGLRLSAIGEARNAGGFWRAWARNVAVAAAAGAFLALVGAAQTGAAPLNERLLYWVPLMAVGTVLGGAVASGALRVLPTRANIWLLGGVIALGVAAIGGGFVIVYTHAFWGMRYEATNWPGFVMTLLAISAAMTGIMLLANRPGAATHADPGAAPPRFFERLPPKLRGAALYAVSAEDHYLRLRTSKGEDLILMRLSDAISELAGLEGAQTHRSWWVAREAVDDVRRDGERVTLVLKGGVEAPVSRPNVRALREAGWF